MHIQMATQPLMLQCKTDTHYGIYKGCGAVHTLEETARDDAVKHGVFTGEQALPKTC